MTELYVRHPDLAIATHDGRSILVLPGRPPVVLERPAPAALTAALATLEEVRPASEVTARLDVQTLAILLAHGFVVAGDDADALRRLRDAGAPSGEKRCKRLVFGITGAIGAVATFGLLLHLQRHFAERIDVVLTEGARKIVRRRAFRFLGLDCWTDAFAPRGDVNVPHIHLAAADLVVVAPASASTIQKIASGACADLLSLVVTATRAPVVVAPSMNRAMWESPAVRANVALLKSRGLVVVEPVLGFEVSAGASGAPEYGPATLDPAIWSPLLDAVLTAPAASG